MKFDVCTLYKKIIIILSLLIIFSTFALQNNALVLVKFDIILDEKIAFDDPRIKSIIYVAKIKQKPIKISFSNPNGEILAKKLSNMFIKVGVQILSLGLFKNESINEDKYILVNIVSF